MSKDLDDKNFDSISNSHRDEALDEIIAYENELKNKKGSASDTAVDENASKKVHAEVAQDQKKVDEKNASDKKADDKKADDKNVSKAKKTSSSTKSKEMSKEDYEQLQTKVKKSFANIDEKSAKAGKNPYNIVLSVQFLFVLAATIITFVGVVWCATKLPKLYFIGFFVGNIALLFSFLFVIYYYISGFKHHDKLFIAPLASSAIAMCAAEFMFYCLNVPMSLAIIYVLIAVAAILFIIPIFTINKTYVCIFSLALCSIVLLAYAVINLIFLTIPYLDQLGSDLFVRSYYYSSLFTLCILAFSLLLCYIENTKRKVIETSYETWIDRGDGSFWKFG